MVIVIIQIIVALYNYYNNSDTATNGDNFNYNNNRARRKIHTTESRCIFLLFKMMDRAWRWVRGFNLSYDIGRSSLRTAVFTIRWDKPRADCVNSDQTNCSSSKLIASLWATGLIRVLTDHLVLLHPAFSVAPFARPSFSFRTVTILCFLFKITLLHSSSTLFRLVIITMIFLTLIPLTCMHLSKRWTML